MITKLELRNFQSHPHTELEFAPDVNAIIGASDSGKTAIFRALRWMIWNRPLGDSFRSDWGGDTSVTIHIPDHIITRWKHDKEHGYTIDGIKLTAIKTEVPEDVTNILNIDDINLQQQFDRPFLLDSSSGEVAAHFNKVAHLDSIGNTLKTLTAWQRILNQDVRISESKIKEYEQSLSKFNYLPDMEIKIEQAEKYQEEIDSLSKDMEALSRIIDSLEEIELQLEELAPLLRLEKDIQKYLLLRDTKIAQEARKDALYSIIIEVNASIHNLNELIAVQSKETSVNKALELVESLNTTTLEKSKLIHTIFNLKGTIKDLYDSENEINTLQREFDTMFPDICPLCGNRKKGK